jgi:nucleotide-binding universal stress UspA family protein
MASVFLGSGGRAREPAEGRLDALAGAEQLGGGARRTTGAVDGPGSLLVVGSADRPSDEEERMRVVVGYDGSDSAKRALQRVVDFAGNPDRILVVAAAESHARTGIAKGSHLDPSEVEQRRGDLEEAQQFFSERGIEAEAVEAQGDPGAVIVEAAKDADLVVVGTRGLNPIERLLLGSVSSKVVHRAPCDVLIVR